jgi:hypothetical protein
MFIIASQVAYDNRASAAAERKKKATMRDAKGSTAIRVYRVPHRSSKIAGMHRLYSMVRCPAFCAVFNFCATQVHSGYAPVWLEMRWGASYQRGTPTADASNRGHNADGSGAPAIAPGTYSTASQTCSQEVRNDSAVSFQESLRAQRARTAYRLWSTGVGFHQPRVIPMRHILAGGVERVGSMSRNRATAKQRKQQQYRYGYRASSQRTQGETAPEACKPFAAEEKCAERARHFI